MELVLKYINVILLASVKFFWATPYAYFLRLDQVETFVMMQIGGLLGFVFFYYFFSFMLKELRLVWPAIYYITPRIFKVRFEQWLDTRRYRRLTANKFTRRNKMIVKIRQKTGMLGIVILTPIVLSIPLGAFLGTKYFHHKRSFIPWTLLSIFAWGFISVLFFSTFMPH
jgi:ABC-type antimicrobial peptide transport system permease subunit